VLSLSDLSIGFLHGMGVGVLDYLESARVLSVDGMSYPLIGYECLYEEVVDVARHGLLIVVLLYSPEHFLEDD
jgi:hypothetical protein